jgi:surface antigen
VSDSRPVPDGDANISGSTIAEVAPARFPTRRELREFENAQRARGRRRATTRPAPLPAQLPAPAYTDAAAIAVASRKLPKRRITGLMTMAVVGGLFASAGLPAYALETAGGRTDVTSATLALAGLEVSADAKLATVARGSFDATSSADVATQRSNAVKQANYEAYMASDALDDGDDYPWFSEMANTQGGGLSPLNYYYRECVDFVAWRLNRDVGSMSAPFVFDWSYLTPNGGDAVAWRANWDAHGWKTGTTPEVGSVAWFGGHVAYVAAVYKDGTIRIEEYNYGSRHLYGSRIIAADSVPAYLYAPPLP